MKTTLFAVAAIAAAVSPAVASAQDAVPADGVAGLRLEGQVMWERLNDPEEDIGINYELGSGIGFGAEVGYDVKVGDSVVVGPFASYNFSTIEQCEDGLCVASDGGYIVGLHVGFAAGEKGMGFAKLGYMNQTLTVVGPYTDPDTGVDYTFDERESGGGYHFAFGYEHRFGDPLYGRVELGIGEVSDIYGFDFQRAEIGLALGARF